MIICSYHSNLYIDAFKQHVEEIKAKGFDTILFCITETDLFFNLETFREFRMYAESKGLYCWATFWGLTAGEAICKECSVTKWLDAIWNIGFFNVMIDEPKELSDIDHFTKQGARFNFHLCLCDDTFKRLTDEEIKSLSVKTIGLSCYFWIKDWAEIVERTFAMTRRLMELAPKNNFVFIQGFDIRQGYEALPSVVKEAAEIQGITNFGFWSFRCTAGTSSKRPVNHEMIWKSINFKEQNRP